MEDDFIYKLGEYTLESAKKFRSSSYVILDLISNIEGDSKATSPEIGAFPDRKATSPEIEAFLNCYTNLIRVTTLLDFYNEEINLEDKESKKKQETFKKTLKNVNELLEERLKRNF